MLFIYIFAILAICLLLIGAVSLSVTLGQPHVYKARRRSVHFHDLIFQQAGPY